MCVPLLPAMEIHLMSISFNPRHHLSTLHAFRKHRENLRKDAEWERDIESYKRTLDCVKIAGNLCKTSLTAHVHYEYWVARKEALEKKWPQLKKIFD